MLSLLCFWFAKPKTLLIILFLSSFNLSHGQQDPSTMNGGSCLAMAGKDCIALAIDKRFGSGSSLININTQPDSKVLLLPSQNSLVMVSCTGLQGDVQSLQQDLKNIVATKYNYNYNNPAQAQHSTVSNKVIGTTAFLSPRSMASLTSHVLYNRRSAPYYVEPIIVGLEIIQQQQKSEATDNSSTNNNNHETSKISLDDETIITAKTTATEYRYRPYLCSLDMVGAKSMTRTFCCSGVASQSLYGTAEALWKPNLNEQQLVDICAQAFTTALERDCLSGYGAVVYLLSPNKGIVAYDISSRND